MQLMIQNSNCNLRVLLFQGGFGRFNSYEYNNIEVYNYQVAEKCKCMALHTQLEKSKNDMILGPPNKNSKFYSHTEDSKEKKNTLQNQF